MNAGEGACQSHYITGNFEGGSLPGHYDYVISVESGTHTITLDSVTIEFNEILSTCSVIEVRDGATLTLNLVGNNDLHPGGVLSHPAIWVEDGATLIIEGEGALNAYGTGNAGGGAAGIGAGSNDGDFGDIIINSGTVKSYGSAGGAGIGGGYNAAGTCQGNVTINGGVVYAVGDSTSLGWSTGAGIGAGENSTFTGIITINGGLVYAQSGDDDMPSIGGGSIAVDIGHCTFTTGESGHAVIIAPHGIGDHSQFDQWDGIFLSYCALEDDVTYDANSNTYTFHRTPNDPSQYNAEVFGEVTLDSNIVIDSGATLNVLGQRSGSSGSSINSAKLHIPNDKTITNNGEIDVAGDLYLHGDQSLYTGQGKLNADSGIVHVLLTQSMVSSESGTNSKIFDNEPFVNNLVVKTVNLWEYNNEYQVNDDYSLTGDIDKVNAGDYSVNISVPQNSVHLLETGTTITYTYTIQPHDIVVNMPTEWTLQKDTDYVAGLPKNPNSVEPTDNPLIKVPYDYTILENGRLNWYNDINCLTPITDSTTLSEGQIIYWLYQHTDPNFVTEKSGALTVRLSEYPPITITISKEDLDVTNRTISEEYGATFILKPTFTLQNAEVTPPVIDYQWTIDSNDE